MRTCLTLPAPFSCNLGNSTPPDAYTPATTLSRRIRRRAYLPRRWRGTFYAASPAYLALTHILAVSHARTRRIPHTLPALTAFLAIILPSLSRLTPFCTSPTPHRAPAYLTLPACRICCYIHDYARVTHLSHARRLQQHVRSDAPSMLRMLSMVEHMLGRFRRVEHSLPDLQRSTPLSPRRTRLFLHATQIYATHCADIETKHAPIATV